METGLVFGDGAEWEDWDAVSFSFLKRIVPFRYCWIAASNASGLLIVVRGIFIYRKVHPINLTNHGIDLQACDGTGRYARIVD